ncbi:MAG: GMC family oxidoreductase [Gammaproteobacteria bacterium]|nr:GMC family oxidoreductase [Gammaproteobacteria bacterium]
MTAADYDAVIIGAGSGGGASAWALAKQGLRVLILEAGPHYNPFADYRLDKADWEQQGFPFKPNSQGRYTYGAAQRLDNKHWAHLRSWNHISGFTNPTNKRIFHAYHHVRGVGGSTLHFSGEAHRLHPDAMHLYTRFGAGADWPIDYKELEPFYCEAENLIGVAGPARNSVRWRSRPYPLPPHPHGYADRKIQAGCKKLGLHWEPNALAILSRPYQGRPPCNYCANCGKGCPRRDKGSVDVTFIPAALATGRCIIKTESPAVRLIAGKQDAVTAVVYARPDGALEKINTPLVLLAAGAVETPRLLLASANSQMPDGVANESGLVGRNFLETLFFVSSGLHSEPLGSNRGLPSDGICWDFNAPDAIPGVIGGCRFSSGGAEANLSGSINYATRVVPGWGKKHKRALRETFGKVLSVAAIGESLPDAKTYVDLDPVAKDELGIPLARIHSRLDKMALQRLDFMARHTRRILDASGAENIFEKYGSYDFFNSTHVFGTCRMGDNPEKSVANRHGRSHRWKNLFIVDASVFPSSGGGESPSLTIAALAIRTARLLHESS